jgi:hypothetical protein
LHHLETKHGKEAARAALKKAAAVGMGLRRKSAEANVKFYSQVGQDRFLLENFFRGRRNGVFLDIGAYDGETLSNTLFFEESMGWTGLCVEPLPSAFAKLKARRKAVCEKHLDCRFRGEAELLEADDVHGENERMFSGLVATFDARQCSASRR